MELVDIVIEIDRATLNGLITGELDLGGKAGMVSESPAAALFESGAAQLTTGTPEQMAQLFSYLDPPSDEPIPITLN